MAKPWVKNSPKDPADWQVHENAMHNREHWGTETVPGTSVGEDIIKHKCLSQWHESVQSQEHSGRPYNNL